MTSQDCGLWLRAAGKANSAPIFAKEKADHGTTCSQPGDVPYHFVTDEHFDRQVFAALRAGSEEQLRAIPRKLLNAGSSEIRNWIAVAAASRHLQLAWDEYIPVYRTTAGTGCGLGFARWS